MQNPKNYNKKEKGKPGRICHCFWWVEFSGTPTCFWCKSRPAAAPGRDWERRLFL